MQPEDSGLAGEGRGDGEDLGIFSAESEGQRRCGCWLGCWKESHVEEDSGFLLSWSTDSPASASGSELHWLPGLPELTKSGSLGVPPSHLQFENVSCGFGR